MDSSDHENEPALIAESASEAVMPGAPRDAVESLFGELRGAMVDALESGDPKAAMASYRRALSLREELGALELPESIQGRLDGFIEDLEARFPTAWRLRAAAAAGERAGHAVAAEVQRAHLEEAVAVLRGGLEDPACDGPALRGALAAFEAALSSLGDGVLEVEALDVALDAGEADLEAPSIEFEGGPPPTVEIELEVLEEVSGAALRGAASPVRRIHLRNAGSSEISGWTLEVGSSPSVVLASTVELPNLGPGEALELGGQRLSSLLRVDRGVPSSLNEVADGSLRVRVLDGDGTEVAAAAHPWRVHPLDSWSGLDARPELLAAYVLPNEDAVQSVLARAGELLEEATGESALDGYQSKDPRRALRIAEAVHRSIAAEGITYANPPASFESAGQRVRFPSKILSTRLATCLDLALLECACLEQAGLNPIVVMLEGHAMAAAWLVERTFSTSVVDEIARFEKRVELTEIVVVDSVRVTEEPAPGFDAARAKALEHLGRGGEFLCVVDVARARLAGVRPLGTSSESTGCPSVDGGSHDAGVESNRDLDADVAAYLAAEKRRKLLEETPATRLDRWLTQLLDLTMRNRLLNSSSGSKRVLPLLGGGEAGAIEDGLADGKSYRIAARPGELDGIAEPGPEHLEPLAGLFADGAAKGRLYSSLSDAALAERLTHLYREARTAREEGGASGLYLAIGFLQFLETKQSTRPRRAPLLLVPLELKRLTGAGKGYSLSIGADEPRFNVTLLEYLRRDHEIDVTGLDPLPMDDSGIDVPLVLRIVRTAVKDMVGWEVVDALEVGLYSFAKHLLWRDLRERQDDLRRSPLVEHLIDRPSEPFPGGEFQGTSGDLDGEVKTSELFAPLSHDSSQLRAILAAAAGATMVLEGPPGTGKSQTITNLIAHSIASGKSVLFVSEKMAALDVVQRRLEQLGLGPACLELHSNKASKKAVLAQFKAALDAGRVRGAKRRLWEEIASDVDAARERLNGHVAALHGVRSSGETVHGLIAGGARAELEGGGSGDVDLGIADPLGVQGETLHDWRAALEELDVQARAVRVGPDHALLLLGQVETSPLQDAEGRRALLAFDEPIGSLIDAARAAEASLGIEGLQVPSVQGWRALAEFLRHAADLPESGGGGFPWLADPGLLDVGARLLGEAHELAEIRERLRGLGAQDAVRLDLDRLDALRREREGGGWFKRWRTGRRLAAGVRGVVGGDADLDVDRAVAIVVDAVRAKELDGAMARSSDAGGRLFGSGWIEAELGVADEFLDRARALAGAWGALASELGVKRAAHAREIEGVVLGARPDEFRARAEALGDGLGAFEAALEAVQDAAMPLGGVPVGLTTGEMEQWRTLVRRWVDGWRGLRPWTRYQRARRAAMELGLEPLVRGVEGGVIAPGNAREVFDSAFAAQLVLHEISADERLKAFDGEDHGRAIEAYRALDDERLSAAAEEVRALLGRGRPTGKELDESAGKAGSGLTGLALLQRELTKKTRHLAIRRLLLGLGERAVELKPCFLMSPMSVAQYLDAGHAPFDLVVFDEASQIPVWDAIGSLARGKQAVIVGDPKQLPPTSFFARGEDEATAEDDVQDLESILDECISAQVPTQRLTWHYRSRDESLIAFSNERYYDGELVTFPGNREQGGVGVRFVEDGVYEKGSTRTNPLEAAAVVEEVMGRLAGQGERRGSIGVVTFNQAQAQLLQDLFERALAKQPELESFFAEGNDDGVFVKNLENVQGDERDAIIFSIGYGPDARGRVSMNFGPLNKDGGERRLNVAITRAREEVLVFTSLRSEQIDLARTNARGVRDLREFLRYGERLPAGSGREAAGGAHGDLLVDSIAAALGARGHQVDVGVGRGSVRVDLGVRDSGSAARYLLGIETDGLGYRAAATARDRDRLRADVLEGLGWNLIRVWSVDWWRDERTELERIEAAIDAARRGKS